MVTARGPKPTKPRTRAPKTENTGPKTENTGADMGAYSLGPPSGSTSPVASDKIPVKDNSQVRQYDAQHTNHKTTSPKVYHTGHNDSVKM